MKKYEYKERSQVGITQSSIERFKHLQKLGRIERIELYTVGSQYGPWPRVCVYGVNGKARFNGLAWGYGGEGPRGLATLLYQVGYCETYRACMDAVVALPADYYEGIWIPGWLPGHVTKLHTLTIERPRSLEQALRQGYIVSDQKWQRGYTSRIPRTRHSLYIAKGSRAGQLYAIAPSYQSTRYCHRLYLV